MSYNNSNEKINQYKAEQYNTYAMPTPSYNQYDGSQPAYPNASNAYPNASNAYPNDGKTTVVQPNNLSRKFMKTFTLKNYFLTKKKTFIENNTSNVEGGGQWGDMGTLKDKNIRIGFIRKVYLILSAQLLFTFGFVLICVFVFVAFIF